MIEKKFRAWNKKEKKWMDEEWVINQSIWQLNPTDSIYEWVQYTGLKDKKGVKIFEGDIIDWAGLKPLTIAFENCSFYAQGFGSKDVLNLTQEGAVIFAEVIGNLYENEDLLK